MSISNTAETLNTSQDENVPVVSEENLLRANAYGLLSSALLAPPQTDLLDVLKGIEGDESAFGQALSSLSAFAKTISAEDIEDEFTRLFYGHGAGGELHPYASFYRTGFIYDKPLAALRVDLAALGLSKSDVTPEPEDHIAFLMNVMQDMIVGAHGQPECVGVQKDFYEKHIAPWATKFFEDLETAENAQFFRPVGTIGKVLMDIETEAFSIAA